MNYDIDERNRAFHLLDKLGNLEQYEIEKYFSDDILKPISVLLNELSDDKSLPGSLSQADFSELILELRKIKRVWGRKLGDAIILAANKAESEDIDGAINVLEDFIKNCTSPFHRRHAQNQIEYYIKKGTGS